MSATAPPDERPKGDDGTDSTSDTAAVGEGGARSLLSAAVYSLGFAIQRAIGLLMLPVYTSALAPSEYGVVGILFAVSVAAGVVFSVGLETAIVRNYFRLARDPESREAYLDSVWRFLVAYPLAASVALAAIAWPFVGSGRVGGLDVLLTLLASAASTAATTLPLAVLRARQDLRGYLWMTAVSAATTPALTFLFVVVLEQSIRGWFIAAVIANLATFAAASIVVPWRRGGALQWGLVRASIIFSLPLLPHFLSHWALQLADRGVIAGIVSESDLGLYTLAANLASPVMMLVMALNQGFLPSYARAGTEQRERSSLSNVVVFQLTAVAGITLAGAMLGPCLVSILTTPDYNGAARLVPWLVLGYGLLGAYFIPMNGATLGAGRSTFAWVATTLSAAVNIGLLFLLVPQHGIYSAAIASAVAYFILLVLIAIWAHSGENPVQYDWPRIIAVMLVGGVVYCAATLTTSYYSWSDLGLRAGWLLVFAGTLAALSRPWYRSRLRRDGAI